MLSEFIAAADPVAFARHRLGSFPDPLQVAFLRSFHPRRLLCCTRQWGKSTLTAVLAVHRLLYAPPGNLTLALAPSLRQSGELLYKARAFLRRLGLHPRSDGRHPYSLAFPNGSRLVALPSLHETIRGFSAASLLIVDEAAQVPDDLYFAVRPMVATSCGAIVLLSTPYGQRGSFWNLWQRRDPGWQFFSVPAPDCPRISAGFLAEERPPSPIGLSARNTSATSSRPPAARSRPAPSTGPSSTTRRSCSRPCLRASSSASTSANARTPRPSRSSNTAASPSACRTAI